MLFTVLMYKCRAYKFFTLAQSVLLLALPTVLFSLLWSWGKRFFRAYAYLNNGVNCKLYLTDKTYRMELQVESCRLGICLMAVCHLIPQLEKHIHLCLNADECHGGVQVPSRFHGWTVKCQMLTGPRVLCEQILYGVSLHD